MCPPGVDQTTRSTQQWNLLAPLLEQKHRFFDYHRRRFDPEFEEFSKLEHTTFAFQRLARLTNNSPVALAPIEGLPAELLTLVNENLGKTDVLALGASSSTLWMHAVQYIESDYRRSMAPWAGTPLVYTGTYLKALPPTLYEAFPDVRNAETEWQRRMQSPNFGRGHPHNGMCPARRWNWSAVSKYETVAGKTSPEQWRMALSDVPDLDQNMLERLAGKLDKVFPAPAAGEWSWRNLTLKQYVKLDVSEKGEPAKLQVLVSKAPRLSLDMALLAQTRWSLSGPRAYNSKAKDKRVWAGHCFDVVQEQPAEEGWEDVTETVKEVAGAVMRSEDTLYDSEEDVE